VKRLIGRLWIVRRRIALRQTGRQPNEAVRIGRRRIARRQIVPQQTGRQPNVAAGIDPRRSEPLRIVLLRTVQRLTEAVRIVPRQTRPRQIVLLLIVRPRIVPRRIVRRLTGRALIEAGPIAAGVPARRQTNPRSPRHRIRTSAAATAAAGVASSSSRGNRNPARQRRDSSNWIAPCPGNPGEGRAMVHEFFTSSTRARINVETQNRDAASF
jgi:hypothetical protein